MSDPTVLTVEECGSTCDPHWIRDSRERAAKEIERIPRRFAAAVVTEPAVRDWVVELVKLAVNGANRTVPAVTYGPSLRLVGPIGTGKTYQAWGALRALAVSGARCSLRLATAADIYARLRPRHGVDSETEFQQFADASVLVIDDVGAEKPSEWTEEVNHRLVNHRYEHERPTLITSNLTAPQLREFLGERVASRLADMSTQVAIKGEDRRRNGQ